MQLNNKKIYIYITLGEEKDQVEYETYFGS